MITTLFVVLGWILALMSWGFVSDATTGVAGMCFACFMGIVARIAQADKHHTELVLAIEAW